jgi:low affinity Fe/Cu permease
MTEIPMELHAYVRRWGRRLRLAESVAWAPWGAAAGLGVGLLLALAARLWPFALAEQLAVWAGLLVFCGIAMMLVIVWLRPRGLLWLARVFDRRFELAERLSTAAEIATGRLHAASAMAEAQLADTLDAVRHAEPRRSLPLRAPGWAVRALVMATVALVLLLSLPNSQEIVLLQQAAVQAAIEERIEQLEAVKEQVAEIEGLTEAEREALLQALEEAIAGLEEGRATPEEALAALSEAEQKLAELREPGAAGLQEGLKRAGEQVADSELTRDLAEALAEGDYGTAAEALAEYGDEIGETLTREGELDLAEQLAEAAEALAESDPDLAEQLARAAEAIEAGDIAQAQEALKASAQQMGEAGERVKRQEAVEGALAELQEGREQITRACTT